MGRQSTANYKDDLWCVSHDRLTLGSDTCWQREEYEINIQTYKYTTGHCGCLVWVL